MKIVFRADASQIIGSGHIMRCLTLAEYLRGQGNEVFFICRQLPGNMIETIEKKEFKVFYLPHDLDENDQFSRTDWYASWLGTSLEKEFKDTKNHLMQVGEIDWLIVDHYALDERWGNRLREYVRHIMVIDDLANRKHNCDLLLDQNYYTDMNRRYAGLVSPKCQLLLGPKYALLRQEFVKARKKIKIRDGNVRRILVFMGGADSTNVTKKVLQVLEAINFQGMVDVVVGVQNKFKYEIKDICKGRQDYTFYCQIDNISELMLKADLAIGAGGASTWERCCLGLPSMVITLAENQEQLARDAQAIEAIVYLGNSQIKLSELAEKIEHSIYDCEKMQAMSKRSFDLVDGLGSQRVSQYVII